jgi:CBS domain-containing protein
MKTPVADVLRHKGSTVYSIDENATVFEAIKAMSRNRAASLLILKEGNRLAGIITEQDGREALLAGKDLHQVRVRDVMTRQIFKVSPDTPIEMCMELMTEKRVRHLPVVKDGDVVVGVVSIGDLVKFLCDKRGVEIDNLSKYITGSM